jgi:hypothetical protein
VTRWTVVGFLTAAVLYVALAAPLISVPLRGDETLWPRQSNAIVETGVPKVPFGADAYVWTKDSFSGRYGADYGLYHPPGYLYVLAAAEATTDNWRVAGRGLALLLGLVTIALQFAVTRRLALRGGWGEPRATAAATIGALSLGTAPYWVFGSMNVDIDPGALSITTLGAAAAALAVVWRPSGRAIALFAVAIVALMWVKPTSYPFVAFGALALALLRRDRSLAVRLVLGLVSGLVAFAATWALYVGVTGVPWDYPWRFSYFPESTDGRGTGSLRPGSPFAIANTARILVSQLGWPSTLVGLTAVFGLGARLVRRRPVQDWDLLTLVGLSLALFYVVFFYFPGKYVVPAFAPLLAAGALELIAGLASVRLSRRALAAAAALAPAVFLFQWLVVGDMITGPKQRLAGEKNFGHATSDPRIAKYILAAAVIVAAALAFRLVGERRWGLLAVVAVIVPWNVGEVLAVRPQQHEWIQPTRETGFRSAIAWANANVQAGDLIESYYEVGYYLRRGRIIPIDQFGMSWSMDQAGRALETRPVEYVLLSRARPPDGEYATRLARRFRPIRELGDWVVYRRTGD